MIPKLRDKISKQLETKATILEKDMASATDTLDLFVGCEATLSMALHNLNIARYKFWISVLRCLGKIIKNEEENNGN